MNSDFDMDSCLLTTASSSDQQYRLGLVPMEDRGHQESAISLGARSYVETYDLLNSDFANGSFLLTTTHHNTQQYRLGLVPIEDRTLQDSAISLGARA